MIKVSRKLEFLSKEGDFFSSLSEYACYFLHLPVSSAAGEQILSQKAELAISFQFSIIRELDREVCIFFFFLTRLIGGGGQNVFAP